MRCASPTTQSKRREVQVGSRECRVAWMRCRRESVYPCLRFYRSAGRTQPNRADTLSFRCRSDRMIYYMKIRPASRVATYPAQHVTYPAPASRAIHFTPLHCCTPPDCARRRAPRRASGATHPAPASHAQIARSSQRGGINTTFSNSRQVLLTTGRTTYQDLRFRF